MNTLSVGLSRFTAAVCATLIAGRQCLGVRELHRLSRSRPISLRGGDGQLMPQVHTARLQVPQYRAHTCWNESLSSPPIGPKPHPRCGLRG